MRKILAMLFSIIIIFCFASCSEHKQDEKARISDTNYQSVSVEMIEYLEFIKSFKELLSELPEYTITQLSDVTLDNGTSHIFTISDTLLGDKYRLRIDTDKNEKVTWVLLSTERRTYGNIQFALFSYYVYRSMDLYELDPDSFYERYDLFSKEKIFENEQSDGYEFTSMTIDTTNEITFQIKIVE